MFDLSKKNKLASELNPFFYLCNSMTTMTYKYSILLIIQVIALILTKSYGSVLVISFTFAGGLLASVIYYILTKEAFYKNTEVIIQSILIGFFLPSTYPLFTAFLCSLILLLLYKIFVRHSNNWLTPSALAIVIAWFVGKHYFPEFLITQDLIISKNPSVSLITQGAFPVYGFDSSITNFLNTYILYPFRVTVPEGLISLLWDTNSSIPAFRFNLLNIIATIVIFCDNNMMEIIPALFMFVYAVLVRLFGPVVYGGIFNTGDVILALLSSGTLFAVAFMFQYPGTVPITKNAKLLFGILAGIIAFLVNGAGTSPIGTAYIILICNIFNLLLRSIEDARVEKKLKINIFSL
ncbi:RnfABCDGE type electron transport complex subunit D [Treponema sp. C6A8]|uniref:RnfABCDGE type electron transport complex subunit D n=1 Tax=Treponema sp. C6A8 TaxID=1410609 RepID=UPI0004832EAC|nr:RnfABCDGE type electron transport complex subunit D [Treponema sp. C6A8]